MSYLLALVVYTLAIIILAVETAGKHSRRTIAQPIRARNAWILEDTFNPSDFLNWDFFSGEPDPTHGQVNYLSQADAQSKGLAEVTVNNTFVMRVDSTTQLPSGANRDS